MPLRVCSILGTLLLALCVTSPAFAKKKKGDDSDKATSSQGSAKKTKKGKKDDTAKPAKPDDTSAGAADETKKPGEDVSGAGEPQETAEPTSWERPPVEQEKPAAPPPKPVEKPKGSDRPISVALFAGWAFMTDRQTNNIGTGADPYGLGAGLRGGYTFDFHLYVGVFFSYYLGSSVTGSSQAVNTPTVSSSASYMQFGAEAGYDWWVGPVIVRPSLEIGAGLAFASVANVNKTVGDIMFGPGISVVHPWDNVFLGGEGRFLLVTGDGTSAFLLAATGGLRFE